MQAGSPTAVWLGRYSLLFDPADEV